MDALALPRLPYMQGTNTHKYNTHVLHTTHTQLTHNGHNMIGASHPTRTTNGETIKDKTFH